MALNQDKHGKMPYELYNHCRGYFIQGKGIHLIRGKNLIRNQNHEASCLRLLNHEIKCKLFYQY